MKELQKQWKIFLAERPCWPYDIVPGLINKLDTAIKASDDKSVNDTLGVLEKQGIILDTNGNLKYYTEIKLD